MFGSTLARGVQTRSEKDARNVGEEVLQVLTPDDDGNIHARTVKENLVRDEEGRMEGKRFFQRGAVRNADHQPLLPRRRIIVNRRQRHQEASVRPRPAAENVTELFGKETCGALTDHVASDLVTSRAWRRIWRKIELETDGCRAFQIHRDQW